MQKSLADSFYWASRPENGISGWLYELLGRLFEAFSPGVQDDSARVRFERLREVGGDGLIPGGGSFKDFMRAAMNMDPAAVRQIIKSDPALREKLEKLGGSDAIEVMLRELGPDGGSFKGYLKSLIETAGPQRVKDLLTGNPDMVKMAKELAGFEGTDEDLKAFVDREIDKLVEEVEAVKGMINGPLDASVVMRKFRDFVSDTKAKAAGAPGMHAMATQARDDQAERDRKDRENHRTLTWLLANDRAYREAHERAMASFTDAGRAIDRAIEAGEKAHQKIRQQIDGYLASTARLKDGRYVMIDEDGTHKDQNGNMVSAEDAAEVEGQPIRAFKPYDEMHERKAQIESGLAELRDWSIEVGDMHNKADDEESPASREELDGMTERADDLAERAAEMQRAFEAVAPNIDANRHLDLLERKESTATMAMPQLP